MPFDLMKKMAKTFGFDAMLGGAVKKRIAKLRAGEARPTTPRRRSRGRRRQPDDDARRRQGAVARVARLRDGLRRVDRASSAARSSRRAPPDQIERWGLPLATMQQIGSWCLTEPGAGSDAFGSMRTTARPDGDGYVAQRQQDVHHQRPGRRRVPRLREDRSRRAARRAGRRDVHRRARHARRHRRPAVQEDGHARLADERGVLRRRAARRRAPARRQGEGRGGPQRHQGQPRQRALRRAAMAWGIIERCYDASLAYVRERKQFGRADRRVPGGAAQDHRPVPEAAHRRERRVPLGVDAAERRQATCRSSTRPRRCARRWRSTPR